MSAGSLDLSAERELVPLAETLRPVAARAAEAGIDWVLIGAAGRDLVLGYVHGLPTTRATLDVDVAVQVASWDQFELLRDALVEGSGATKHRSAAQRLVFPGGSWIDLVPFGGVETGGTIAWPPPSGSVLEACGLREALESSRCVLLPGALEVRVPTVECFLALKLLAWRDRHLELPRHDSVDLGDILKSAEELIGIDALYGEHEDALVRSDWDPRLASLEVLGTRLARVASDATRRALSDLLEGELDRDGRLELVRELGGGAETLRALAALRRGVGAPTG